MKLRFPTLVKFGLVIGFSLAISATETRLTSEFGSRGVTDAHAASTGKSGLPLPRFVSLKSKRVNMRVGPGREFKVIWMYLKPGLPMEIIQEYDNWRKVRDPEGNEGWILHSLLSGKRTAIVNPWETDKTKGLVTMHKEDDDRGPVVAKLEPGVVAEVDACTETACQISVSNVNGFVSKNQIWGVYPDEQIEN